MANENQLNSNSKIVNFSSDYEYVLGALQGRILEFSGMFHSMDFLYPQMEQIRYDLEDTAKMFAREQGLAPGQLGWGVVGWEPHHGVPIFRENTGRLYNGIKAVITGQTIHLKSEAQDEYGHYYGGHVEFGHQNVPARPHLRPALYTVSQASQGKLRSALQNLLTGAFSGDMSMAFGTGKGLSASYYRKGPGNITQSMSRGFSGRQMKYHFGSIRNPSRQRAIRAVADKNGRYGKVPLGRGVSRKASTFRNSMSSTAKKSMNWGKQKSLNDVQRVRYKRMDSSSNRARRRTIFKQNRKRANSVKRRNTLIKKSGMSSSQYKKISQGSSFPVHQSAARNYSPKMAAKGNKQYRAFKQQKYYENMKKGFSYMQTNPHGQKIYHKLGAKSKKTTDSYTKYLENLGGR